MAFQEPQAAPQQIGFKVDSCFLDCISQIIVQVQLPRCPSVHIGHDISFPSRCLIFRFESPWLPVLLLFWVLIPGYSEIGFGQVIAIFTTSCNLRQFLLVYQDFFYSVWLITFSSQTVCTLSHRKRLKLQYPSCKNTSLVPYEAAQTSVYNALCTW